MSTCSKINGFIRSFIRVQDQRSHAGTSVVKKGTGTSVVAQASEGKGLVAAILASYRSIDTFGEVIVIFTAGLAVFSLLSVRPTRRKSGKTENAE